MKTSGKIALCACLCLCALFLSIGVGSIPISPLETVRILLHKVGGKALPDAIPATSVPILWTIRLPRVLTAFLVGAMLAVSGTVMQSVLRNPLASSYTMGVSSGASLGAAIVILTGLTLPGLGGYTLPFFGLVAGLAAVALAVTFAARVDRALGSHTIILAGMVFSLFINGILTMFYAFAGENAQRLLHWQMGSFVRLGWREAGLLAPVCLVGILLLMGFTRELDMLTFGEEDATAMGVSVAKVKWILLGLSAALTGSAVAFAGVIGFIDLIAPHVVRRIFGAKHRITLPMAALFGGGFMALCDTAARTIAAPIELPVGALTALVGAPFFAYVYFRGRRAAR